MSDAEEPSGGRIDELNLASLAKRHEGHAHVAETARRRLGLDRVIWLVSPQNPLKPSHETADLAHRMAGAQATSGVAPPLRQERG